MKQIFEKYSDFKFHENPSAGSRGRTDRRDEVNSRFSQFCKRAEKGLMECPPPACVVTNPREWFRLFRNIERKWSGNFVSVLSALVLVHYIVFLMYIKSKNCYILP
jgi:hypothetical protein